MQPSPTRPPGAVLSEVCTNLTYALRLLDHRTVPRGPLKKVLSESREALALDLQQRSLT